MNRQDPTNSDIPLHGFYPYHEVHRERIRAHEKHRKLAGSRERAPWDDPLWLPVLVEEVGEVARAQCEAKIKGQPEAKARAALREELVQVAAMTCAWICALDQGEDV